MTKDNFLIITNGTSAAALLEANQAAAAYLPWDDILHEGPVPLCATLAELSDARSGFLTKRYPHPAGNGANVFERRDARIANYDSFERIELWFEHDLYDQLQLIQILDYFCDADLAPGKLHLVQADEYLGAQPPDKIMRFRQRSEPVNDSHLAAARRAWNAFRQPTPEAWADLAQDDLSALPWLASAVERMLEELPSTTNGLSRTESEFLAKMSGELQTARSCVGLYLDNQPEPAFLGDWSLFNLLSEFMAAKHPLIDQLDGCWTSHDQAQRERFCSSTVRMTPLAHALLAGKADRIEINGIDRWWGGTHLTTQTCWRWDCAAEALVAP